MSFEKNTRDSWSIHNFLIEISSPFDPPISPFQNFWGWVSRLCQIWQKKCRQIQKNKPKHSRIRQCFASFWQPTVSFGPLRMGTAKKGIGFEKNARDIRTPKHVRQSCKRKKPKVRQTTNHQHPPTLLAVGGLSHFGWLVAW